MNKCQVCKKNLDDKEIGRANEAEIEGKVYYICKECRDFTLIGRLKDSIRIDLMEDAFKSFEEKKKNEGKGM